MKLVHPAIPAALAFFLVACSPSGPSGQEAESGDPLADSPSVARVNGESVSRALLDAYLRARGVTGPTPAQTEAAVKELVNLVLMRQQAERSGFADRPDVYADLELQRLSTLATRLARAHLGDNPVTDEQARAEYDRSREVSGTQEYHLRHILLEQRQAAEKVIKTLDEGGDFQQLAEKFSIDERNDAGGDLGWVNLAQLPAPLPDAARKLEPGEHSREPVQSRFGWHVLKLVEKRELDPPSFDQVKSGIVSSLQRRRMEEYVQQLREGADIRVSKDIVESSESMVPESGEPGPGQGGG